MDRRRPDAPVADEVTALPGPGMTNRNQPPTPSSLRGVADDLTCSGLGILFRVEQLLPGDLVAGDRRLPCG